MIDPRTRVYMFVLGLAVLAFVINLLRRRQLQERYALLWLVAGIGLTLAPVFINQIDAIAYSLGFAYPPALILMLAVIGLLLIIFQLSLALSKNSDHLKVLTQQLSIMQHDIDRLAARMAEKERQDSGASERSGSDYGDCLN